MDSVFFWLSKTLWAVATPGSLLVLSVAALWLLLRIGAARAARRLAGLVAVALLLVALLPAGEWLLYPLESRFRAETPETVDGIILLGGSIDPVKSAAWAQPEMRATAEREFTFLELAARYPRARLAFTGGSGSLTDQEYKEAPWAKELYARQGLDAGRVTFESDSRNTYENALFSKKLLAPQPGENWLLITTAWHMPRAVGAFCGAGFPVIPYPVDHSSLRGNLLRLEWDFGGSFNALGTALHEWAGLLIYRLTGKTDRLLPEACAGEAAE